MTFAPSFDLDSVPEHHRDRVKALIPNPLAADQYVHRLVYGVYDFDVFLGAMEDRENIILAGPTGASKTTAAWAFASKYQLPLCIIECHAAMDPTQALGKTMGVNPETGMVEYSFGDMILCILYGGIILIDEVNLAHPRVTGGFHQLLSVLRALSLPEANMTISAGANDNLLLMAAYNPRYAGTVRLSEAFLNRYALPIDWGYERDVEKQLVVSVELLDFADHVRGLAEIRTPVSTNSLMEFERHVGKYGMRFAMGRMVCRFADEERNSVHRALEAKSAKILRELQASAEGTEDLDAALKGVLDQPEGEAAMESVKLMSGRGPSGKLRNFAAMNDSKLYGLAKMLAAENNDLEALAAIEAEMDDRAMVKP